MTSSPPSSPTSAASGSAITILFFGDIVGRPGRRGVRQYLDRLRVTGGLPDVVIANVENVSHGFGLMDKHYHELSEAGIDIMTGGNHIWDKKDLFDSIADMPKLLRPANMHPGTPGSGAKLFDFTQRGSGKSFQLGVVNLIGQAFMGNYPPPWPEAEAHITRLRAKTPHIFVDLHAETTAEKAALAHLSLKWGASALVGTHTHVQTADERILAGRLGFITDAGFNGPYGSIIGMEPKTSIAKMTSHAPVKLEVMEATVAQINAVWFELNDTTGNCLAIRRIQDVIQLNEHF
ncbi:MAG: TIGR00282 family metallophosphoesterase [Vampirovibrionales bacterium]|nr:TIGR00282 family metallophosphoesterase [Vampirovibrionales bacterium]